MLKVKLLRDTAKVPTIGHPGEDLGYDLYSAETVTLLPGQLCPIKTGIAVEFVLPHEDELKWGFLIMDRSSLALKHLSIGGGVVDAGYRGEVEVIMTNHGDEPYQIKVGHKIANLVPIPQVANKIEVISEMTPSLRGENRAGSTGVE